VFNDAGRDLLARGIGAAKANDKAEARYCLEKVLRQDPAPDTRLQAWRYLSEIADDPAEKRRYVEMILAVEPTDGQARRDLAILDGRLDPRDIVDPEGPFPPSALRERPVDVQAATCRHCGSGRLVFAPDGQSVVCEHCRHEQPIGLHSGDGRVDDHDFVAAMWTGRGRRSPAATRCFTCRGCAATFLLAPAALSITCPFCASVYVIDQVETRNVVLPEALIPFGVTASDALRAVRAWQERLGDASAVMSSSGLYFPAWMLTFAGEVRWSGVERRVLDFGHDRSDPVTGRWPVSGCSVLVAASERLPAARHGAMDAFDLDRLVPYDPRYLADWPAETFRVSLEEAAVAARRKAVSRLHAHVLRSLDRHEGLVDMSFARLAVDSFKLLLLPIWIARLGSPDEVRTAIVDGQTGTVHGPA
jgi:hypothetical protein